MRHRAARYSNEDDAERHGEFSLAREICEQKKHRQGAERAGNEMQDDGPHYDAFDDMMSPLVFGQFPGMIPGGAEQQKSAMSPGRHFHTRSANLLAKQCLSAARSGRSRKG